MIIICPAPLSVTRPVKQSQWNLQAVQCRIRIIKAQALELVSPSLGFKSQLCHFLVVWPWGKLFKIPNSVSTD